MKFSRVLCLKCNSAYYTRRDRKDGTGHFWGCGDYPTCSGTLDTDAIESSTGRLIPVLVGIKREDALVNALAMEMRGRTVKTSPPTRRMTQSEFETMRRAVHYNFRGKMGFNISPPTVSDVSEGGPSWSPSSSSRDSRDDRIKDLLLERHIEGVLEISRRAIPSQYLVDLGDRSGDSDDDFDW